MYYNGVRLLSKLLLQVKKTFITISNVRRVMAKRKLLREIRIANEILMNKPKEFITEQSVFQEVSTRHDFFAIEFSLN
jgi:hypothetical protein